MNDSFEQEAAKLKEKFGKGEISEFVYRLALKGLDNLGQDGADLIGPGSIAQNGSAKAGGAAGSNAYKGIYTGLPPENHEEKLRIYRRMAAESVSGISLLGAAEVYVDPDTTMRRHDIHSPSHIADEKIELELDLDDNKSPLSALEAAAQHRRIVILGDPGSGKSTFVNRLCLCLAGHQAAPDACLLNYTSCWPEEEKDILPIPILLRDFAGRMPGKPGTADAGHLSGYIEQRLEGQNMKFAWELLQHALAKGKAILLLDGLDEIPTHDKRIFVRDAVNAFAGRYPDCRIVATCRVLSYQDDRRKLKGFPSAELAPFDNKKINQFISSWYSELVRTGTVKDQNEGEWLAGKLQTAVGRTGLGRLASNPLLLTVMALVHAHKGELPKARSMLYEETVDILLWHREKINNGKTGNNPHLVKLLGKAGKKEKDLKRVLWRLAFDVHKKNGNTDGDAAAGIGEPALLKALAPLHPKKNTEWAKQVVKTIKQGAGLLVEQAPGSYTFPHRTFREYLAGSILASQVNFVAICSKLAEADDQWREAILLAAGRLSFVNGDLSKPLALINELCPATAGKTKKSWRKAWLAGDVLMEIGAKRAAGSKKGRELNRRVRHRLVQLIREGHLEPKERVAAANTLARLGDPRFRANYWHLPYEKGRGLEQVGFVKVPIGTFWMGSDPEKVRNARKEEQPYHQAELDSFYISKYPVTAAQFRAFVKDSGYKPGDPRCLEGIDNHPVVYVTWDDAVAYCRWLTQKIGRKRWVFRLPSEAEWEKAARRDDGRIYPWGDEADANRANYRDAEIGGTSPAGCFPAGASSYGCLDMAGNVWEWTKILLEKNQFSKLKFSNSYDPFAKTGKDKNEIKNMPKVLHGGSFDGDAEGLRCAICYMLKPEKRSRCIGFRCVCAPRYMKSSPYGF